MAETWGWEGQEEVEDAVVLAGFVICQGGKTTQVRSSPVIRWVLGSSQDF
jgi:hypothetical protein